MRLQLGRDRFIAGQAECSFCKHLDSVGLDTLIRDIVDRCRVWESNAEDMGSWGIGYSPERPRAAYQVVNENTDVKQEVASEDSDVLGLLMRHLLPTLAVSPPSDRDLLIQHLLGTVHHVQPVVQELSSLMDIKILESASSRIGGRGACRATGGSSGADGSVFFVWRVRPCDFVVSCSG